MAISYHACYRFARNLGDNDALCVIDAYPPQSEGTTSSTWSAGSDDEKQTHGPKTSRTLRQDDAGGVGRRIGPIRRRICGHEFSHGPQYTSSPPQARSRPAEKAPIG